MGAVEEDAYEETGGDDPAGGKDLDRWTGLFQEKDGEENGEREDKPAGDLIERGVYVFQAVVVRAANTMS